MGNDSECFREALMTVTTLSEYERTLFNALINEGGCNCSHLQRVHRIGNLACAPYPFYHPWFVQLVYILLFTVIVLLSVGGNVTTIWIILAHGRMRTVTNYFLLNLALSDTSISLLNTCFSFTQNFYYQWWFGDKYCPLYQFMGVVPTCSSVFTLIAISIDRWWGLTHPFARRLDKMGTILVICFIWISAGLCGLPMLLYSYTRHYIFYYNSHFVSQKMCYYDQFPDGTSYQSLQFKIYNYFLLFIQYLLPLKVFLVTYFFVGKLLWFSGNIGEHRNQAAVRSKRKVVKMMMVVMSSFVILWLPYHAYFVFLAKIIQSQYNYLIGLHVYLMIYWLAMSTTFVNPFIYCWMNNRFRIGFKYAFRWLPLVPGITYEEYIGSDLCRSERRKRATAILVDSALHTGLPNPTPRKSTIISARFLRKKRSDASLAPSDLNPFTRGNRRFSSKVRLFGRRKTEFGDLDPPEVFDPSRLSVLNENDCSTSKFTSVTADV